MCGRGKRRPRELWRPWWLRNVLKLKTRFLDLASFRFANDASLGMTERISWKTFLADAGSYLACDLGITMRKIFASVLFVLALNVLVMAQDSAPADKSHDMSGMDMSGHDMSSMGGEAHAMHSMEDRHMDMGPHMKMTVLRPVKAGDQEKAGQVVVAARRAAEKYKDYKVALTDGFKIFFPNVPQKQYHFTNYQNAYQAVFKFDPDKPTSLLYEKHGNDYKLVGVMYTARKTATEDELNERIPLSIAQWHAHVNLCMPPADKRQEVLQAHPKFGLRGSISTKEDCDSAGGRFMPQVFGWMVHVYPMESKAEDIWSVEKQIDGHGN